MAQIGFECRLRHPARPSTVGEMQATLDGGHRAGRVSRPMFAQLRGFDGRDDRGPSWATSQCVPCGDRRPFAEGRDIDLKCAQPKIQVVSK